MLLSSLVLKKMYWKLILYEELIVYKLLLCDSYPYYVFDYFDDPLSSVDVPSKQYAIILVSTYLIIKILYWGFKNIIAKQFQQRLI